MAITGYVPGDDGVEAVGQIIRELKGRKKSLFWLLDPVMGDEGKLYVSESVVPVYRSLVEYADLITPNQYEIGLVPPIARNLGV
jgi:pyridoxine kinase